MTRSWLFICLALLLTACGSPAMVSTPAPGLPPASTSSPLPGTSPSSLDGSSTAAIPAMPSPTTESLSDQLDRILADAGGHWNVLIQEVGGKTLYARESDERVLVASTIKVPIALLFIKSLEKENIPPGELQRYLETHGNGEIPYSMLLRNMLVFSDQYSTTEILDAIEENVANSFMVFQGWGVDINIHYRYSSAADLARLWEGLYLGGLISAEGRQILLDLLAEFTENDLTRLGSICAGIPSGCTFYNKRGTITTETLLAADTALITLQKDGVEHAYILVVIGTVGGLPTDYYRLDGAIALIGEVFGSHLPGGK